MECRTANLNNDVHVLFRTGFLHLSVLNYGLIKVQDTCVILDPLPTCMFMSNNSVPNQRFTVVVHANNMCSIVL